MRNLGVYLEQGGLSENENKIFIALMNPRYPKRLRSLSGLARETGLPPLLICELLFCPQHADYLYVGRNKDAGKFMLDHEIFEARHPLFLWNKRN